MNVNCGAVNVKFTSQSQGQAGSRTTDSLTSSMRWINMYLTVYDDVVAVGEVVTRASLTNNQAPMQSRHFVSNCVSNNVLETGGKVGQMISTWFVVLLVRGESLYHHNNTRCHRWQSSRKKGKVWRCVDKQKQRNSALNKRTGKR